MKKRTKGRGKAAPSLTLPAGWFPAEELPHDGDVKAFIWNPCVPRGTLTLLTGLPEAGKTSLLVRLIAGVTGANGPDLKVSGAPGRVLLLSGEDSYRHTLRPRLMLAGANPELIVARTRSTKGGAGRFTLPVGLGQLREAIDATGAVLVVIDPAAAWIDSADLNNETATRAILDGLLGVAQDTGAAVMTTRNFNKRNTGSLLSRINGSAAWRDVPRSIVCCVNHPTERGKRLMVHGKHSDTDAAPPRFYTVEKQDGGVILTLGDVVQLDLEDCEETITSRAEQAEWRAAHELLAGLIDREWVRQTIISAAALSHGISKGKLWRAKVDLGIPHRRVGFGQGGYVEWGPPADGWPSGLRREDLVNDNGHSSYIHAPPPPPTPSHARRGGGGGARRIHGKNVRRPTPPKPHPEEPTRDNGQAPPPRPETTAGADPTG